MEVRRGEGAFFNHRGHRGHRGTRSLVDQRSTFHVSLLPSPDVEAAVNEKGRYMGTPTLCVEILSRSTRSKDLVDKLKTYMLSGVREFWAVDPDKQTVGGLRT